MQLALDAGSSAVSCHMLAACPVVSVGNTLHSMHQNAPDCHPASLLSRTQARER